MPGNYHRCLVHNCLLVIETRVFKIINTQQDIWKILSSIVCCRFKNINCRSLRRNNKKGISTLTTSLHRRGSKLLTKRISGKLYLGIYDILKIWRRFLVGTYHKGLVTLQIRLFFVFNFQRFQTLLVPSLVIFHPLY